MSKDMMPEASQPEAETRAECDHVRQAIWKGKIERRFRLLKLRWEWGRWCYVTDCCEETLESWWEPDALEPSAGNPPEAL